MVRFVTQNLHLKLESGAKDTLNTSTFQSNTYNYSYYFFFQYILSQKLSIIHCITAYLLPTWSPSSAGLSAAPAKSGRGLLFERASTQQGCQVLFCKLHFLRNYSRRLHSCRNKETEENVHFRLIQYSNQMHSLHTLNVETKLKTKKSYTVLSLGFLQDLSSLVQRPFSSDGQRAAAAALDLGHSQQAELEEDLCRGSKIRKKKKPSPTEQIPRYIIQTTTTEMFSCFQKK